MPYKYPLSSRCWSGRDVLIELAFIDNMEDAWLLTNYPDEFARAVACGVTDYEG